MLDRRLKDEEVSYHTELGIKISNVRLSLRFPRWTQKKRAFSSSSIAVKTAAVPATAAAKRNEILESGAECTEETYWEYRQLSKDGHCLLSMPITTRFVSGVIEATFSSSSASDCTDTAASSHLSFSNPPPVPPKCPSSSSSSSFSSSFSSSSPPPFSVRPPYPSSTVLKTKSSAANKKRMGREKRSSYI
jgi:hypothetical protein